MKYTIAIAALCGLLNAVELSKHHHHKHENNHVQVESEFRPNVLQSPWAAPKGKDDPNAKVSPIKDGFPSYFVGHDPYIREPTAQFANPWPGNDDKLMNSLIMKYAIEGNTNGQGNGKFFMTRNTMERVSREVVGTHFGWTGAKRENYLKEKLPALWQQWDVIGEGYIPVARAPTFLRLLLDGSEISEGLQLQTGEQMNF